MILSMQRNNAELAPFKPFAESTAVAWNEINSRPLSCLPYTGDLIEQYRSWVHSVFFYRLLMFDITK